MMFFLFPFSRCCQRHSWPVMLFYFTPSVIRFDVVVSLMVVFFCYFDVRYIYQQILNFASVLVFESISVRYKHCEIFRKISNVWLLLIYIYAFSAKTEDGYSTGNEKIAIRWTMKNYSSVFYMLWADLPKRFWYRWYFERKFRIFSAHSNGFSQTGQKVFVTVINLLSNLYKILLSLKWNVRFDGLKTGNHNVQ